MGWEGETANRTSGLVTALINLPLGHKSPALHFHFSPHSHLHSGTGKQLLLVSSQKAHPSPSGEHRTQFYIYYIYIYLSIGYHASAMHECRIAVMTDYFYWFYVPDENR